MTDKIKELKDRMSALGIDPQKGLGDELFLFVSSLTPIANVDLLVYNEQGQFLLSRRDDPHCGTGWHVPGGCLRLKETLDYRIRKVAKQELGLEDFTYEPEPVKVFEIFNNAQRNITDANERSHFITLVYKCNAPKGFEPDNSGKTESDTGFLKWFDTMPDDLVYIQECYKKL